MAVKKIMRDDADRGTSVSCLAVAVDVDGSDNVRLSMHCMTCVSRLVSLPSEARGGKR